MLRAADKSNLSRAGGVYGLAIGRRCVFVECCKSHQLFARVLSVYAQLTWALM